MNSPVTRNWQKRCLKVCLLNGVCLAALVFDPPALGQQAETDTAAASTRFMGDDPGPNRLASQMKRVQQETAAKLWQDEEEEAERLHAMALPALKQWAASHPDQPDGSADKKTTAQAGKRSPLEGGWTMDSQLDELSAALKMKTGPQDGKYQLHATVADRDASERRMDGYGVTGLTVWPQRFGYPLVTAVLKSTGAEAAGVQAGDRILVVNGHEFARPDDQNVWLWLTGKPGTKVEMTVAREGLPVSFTITRRNFAELRDERTRASFEHMYEVYGPSGQR